MENDFLDFNRKRWNALVQAGVSWGRPRLDLDETSARAFVDPHGFIGDVRGKDVLCLASGGGQQTAAFAVLGANVTVLDLSDEMLAGDRLAAAHYHLPIRIEQGDMRDLSRFADASFDVVYHVYSINFVPRVEPVYDGVQRVLRPGGLYFTQVSNPFSFGIDEHDWTGQGYLLRDPYIEGAEAENTVWDVEDTAGVLRQVAGPREWRHTLSTVLNALAARGFGLLGLWEEQSANPQAESGSWDHFMHIAPPWFSLWYRCQR